MQWMFERCHLLIEKQQKYDLEAWMFVVQYTTVFNPLDVESELIWHKLTHSMRNKKK